MHLSGSSDEFILVDQRLASANDRYQQGDETIDGIKILHMGNHNVSSRLISSFYANEWLTLFLK